MPSVTGLAFTPVKGTRLQRVETISLERGGARGDRRFYVIDARDRMLNGKQLGELNALVADYSEAERRLRLTFPSGSVVQGEVEPGPLLETRFYSRRCSGRLVHGTWSEALSAYTGQELRLVEALGSAVDRGPRGGATLISQASVARLAQAAGERDVDSRRFRMLIEIDGVEAHAEDRWVGHSVRIGDAVIHFNGHVGRCLITSRNPDSGRIDLPTLDIIRSYRRDAVTTAPLPFGVYGQVTQEGMIRVGDRVSPPA